jgi:hypothetical protein
MSVCAQSGTDMFGVVCRLKAWRGANAATRERNLQSSFEPRDEPPRFRRQLLKLRRDGAVVRFERGKPMFVDRLLVGFRPRIPTRDF